MEKKYLLIVDDDPKITDLMKQFLTQYEFIVQTAANAVQMTEALKIYQIDLIVLDIMLPGMDGFDICKKLRAEQNYLPILMLTAAGEDQERVRGLELGADDYLTKPFNPDELLARIRAILRRSHINQVSPTQQHTKLIFAGWMLDKLQRRLISPEGIDVPLTDGEYRLLETLAEHAPEVVSRDDLLEIIENRSAGPYDRSIDVRVSRLRIKLEENPKQPILIKTVRSGGYVLSVEVERKP